MKYIVKVPSMGGWNKAHIWKVGEPFGGQSRITSLCNRGARRSPQSTWIPGWQDRNYPEIPLTTQNPLEGKSDHCEKCLTHWLLNIWEGKP